MIIRLAAFLAGAVLMATEVLAFRVIGRTFGTALRETSAVIAVFLAAMSVGYWLGGRVGDRFPRPLTMVIPILMAALGLCLVPWFDRPLSDAVAGSRLPLATHALLVNALLFALPAAALASVSPIAIRLLAHDVATTGRTAGSIAGLSAMGSIAGTLLAGFYLIGTFPISWILRGLGLGLAVLAASLGLATRASTPGARKALGALLAASALSFTPGAAPAEIIYEHDSAYHHIVVEDRGRYRYLWFDDTAQSRMVRDDPFEGGYEYTRYFHLAWVFNRSIESALFIGLGGGTGPKQFLHDYPGVDIRVAEVDPAVIDVSRELFGLPEDERLTVDALDGRVELRRLRDPVDLIVIDAYTAGRYGSIIPFHLTTDEFFELTLDRLTDRGIVVYNVIQQVSGVDDDFIRALVRTMRRSFAGIYLFECETSNNTVVIATRDERQLGLRAIIAAAEELVASGVVKRKDLPSEAANLYDGDFRTDDVPVLTDDYAPVDRLLGW